MRIGSLIYAFFILFFCIIIPRVLPTLFSQAEAAYFSFTFWKSLLLPPQTCFMGTGPIENIPFLSLYVFSCLAFLSVSRTHCHCSCWQNCCFLWCTLSSASSRFFICFAGSDLFLMITPMLNMQEKDISSSYLCVCLISFSFFCAAGCLQNTGFCRLCFPLSVPAPVWWLPPVLTGCRNCQIQPDTGIPSEASISPDGQLTRLIWKHTSNIYSCSISPVTTVTGYFLPPTITSGTVSSWVSIPSWT